ncbi:MAG: hypothetical protein KDB53_16100, partial [Planctomycetes bacterium]|nr:hypothetical protein [Planctomycetota bacterium]
FVNANGLANTTLRVELAATATASDQLEVFAQDSMGNVVAVSTAPAPAGGGIVDFTNQNLSTLVDGAMTIGVRLSDAAANQSDSGATYQAQIDTMLPVLSSARVAESATNDIDVVNASNAGSVALELMIAQPDRGECEIFAALVQGSTASRAFSTALPPGSVAYTTPGIDASNLGDGTALIQLELIDKAGNVANFQGSSATIDLTLPAGHQSAHVAASISNSLDVINAASAASVQVDVDLLADTDATRTVTVTLGDGASSISSTQTAPVTGGILSFAGLDVRSLADGPVSLDVEYRDAAGNSVLQSGTAASKDTFFSMPVSVVLNAGPSNSMGVANSSNAAAASITAVIASNAGSDESYLISVRDGANSVVTAPMATPQGGGTLNFGPIDLGPLNDGNITVVLIGSDAAGNGTSISSAAFKDTQNPSAAVGASVAAGSLNTKNTINMSNVGSVVVDVVFNSSTESDTSFFVVLTDGASSVSSPSMALNTNTDGDSSGTNNSEGGSGAQTIRVTGLDASALADGPITIRVTSRDPSLNEVSYSTSGVTKDLSTTQPVSAGVAATMNNPANFVNATSASAVDVAVVMPSSASATDMVAISLSDGATTLTPAAQAAPGGGGTMTFTLDASSLVDGNLSLLVNVTAANTNMMTYTGTPAQKDTSAPPATVTVMSNSTPSSPQGFVNASTAANAYFQVSYGNVFVGNETITVTITDGVNMVTDGPRGVTSQAGTINFGPFNLSGFNDGQLTATVTVTDAAGNQSSQSYPAGSLDSTPPNAITDLSVLVGASNAVNFVNGSNVSAARIGVQTANSGSANDVVDVTISRVGTTQGAVAIIGYVIQTPGQRETAGTVDLSGLADGTLEITARVRDTAGNNRTFSGYFVTKDTTAPAAPTSAQVAAGANPVDFINAASAGSVMVDVALAASSVSTDQVRVTLSDGSIVATSNLTAATNGAGTLSLGPINASGLGDGPISIVVTIQDGQSNNVSFNGTMATKDVVNPELPTRLVVAAAAGNAEGIINLSNLASVMVEGTWPMTAAGSEFATVSIGGLSMGPVTVPAGGGVVQFGGIDATSLADGPVALSVSVTEASGNTVVFVGTVPTKDTSTPVLPTAAAVPVSGMNPANVINNQTATMATVDVTWPGGASASDMASVSLSDGMAIVVSAMQNAAPGAVSSYTLDVSSLSDSVLTLVVNVTNVNGNPDTFNGTAPTLDTTAPVSPTAARVAAGGQNLQDIVNSFSVTTTAINVDWPAGASATDTFTVDVTDGVTTLSSASANPNPGASTQSMFDLTTLNDGPISILVSVLDMNLNQSMLTGTQALKDVVAPTAPTSARVAAGASNAQDVINLASVSSVQVDVAWGAGADANDTAFITIADGPNSDVSMAMNANPSNTVSYALDASGLT